MDAIHRTITYEKHTLLPIDNFKEKSTWDCLNLVTSLISLKSREPLSGDSPATPVSPAIRWRFSGGYRIRNRLRHLCRTWTPPWNWHRKRSLTGARNVAGCFRSCLTPPCPQLPFWIYLMTLTWISLTGRPDTSNMLKHGGGYSMRATVTNRRNTQLFSARGARSNSGPNSGIARSIAAWRSRRSSETSLRFTRGCLKNSKL